MVLGRRARRLTLRPRRSGAAGRFDESRAGAWLGGRLRPAGIDVSPSRFAMRAAGWGAAAAAAAWLWMGGAAAIVAGVVAEAVVAGGVRTRTRSRAQRIDESLPAMLDALAAAMRAGASPSVAFDDLEPPPSLAEPLRGMRAAASVGASLREALDVFAGQAGTAQAHMIASAVTLGVESGGDLPRMLDVLAEAARDRTRIAREARVASTQARMSAWVVAALPLVFLFLTGAASREQTQLLLRTPIGWALLGAGGVLEAAGILWMRKLAG